MTSSRNSAASPEDHEAPEWDGLERRETDRRAEPTRPWTNWITPLRREGGRRDSDRFWYVDRYTRRDVVLLLTIFILNVGDAYFTMRWLDRGGREANPFMDFFLDIGPTAFLLQKCLVVGFWLLLLLVHKNFRFARLGLYASLAVYFVLMVVHFAIVLLGVEPPSQDRLAGARIESHMRPVDSHSQTQFGAAYQAPPPGKFQTTEPLKRVDPRASE